jgi:uncharacterized protein YcfL
MKVITMMGLLLLAGCRGFAPIVTVCRHEVYAQASALKEYYPNSKVQIVHYDYFDEGSNNVKRHAQARVKVDGKWLYLRNKARVYHFWTRPSAIPNHNLRVHWDSEKNKGELE